MKTMTHVILLVWVIGVHQSASGNDVTEIAKQIKSTLARSESTIRLPLRARSSVSVESDTPGVNKTPYGSEFSASEGNERLMQTSHSETRAPHKINNSKQPPPSKPESSGFMIAGVQTLDASVLARNPRYAFNLESTKSADSWLLTTIGKSGETSVDATEKHLTSRRIESTQPANWIVVLDGTHELSKLFEADGFNLTGTSESSPGGPVTVKFTRSFRGRTDLAIDCNYTFDPSSGWLPVEWVEKATSADYSRSLRVTQKVAMEKGKYEANTVMTFSSEKPEKATVTRKALYVVESVAEIPESEFTTSAFGIPEPAEFAVHSTPKYVWILILAAVCGLLTIGFRLLARRQSK